MSKQLPSCCQVDSRRCFEGMEGLSMGFGGKGSLIRETADGWDLSVRG